MDPQLEAVSAEYEREIAALKQELLDLSQRQRRVGARDGATSSISSAPSEGEGGLRAETLPQAEAEIARLNLALQHARQLQAATEATASERLADGEMTGSERARALQDMHRKHLARTHKELDKVSKENEALRKDARNFVKQKAYLQRLSERAAGMTVALAAKDKSLVEATTRLAESEQRIARLEAALHEANIKDRRLRDEMEPLRDDLCRLQQVLLPLPTFPWHPCVCACLRLYTPSHSFFALGCTRLGEFHARKHTNLQLEKEWQLVTIRPATPHALRKLACLARYFCAPSCVP